MEQLNQLSKRQMLERISNHLMIRAGLSDDLSLYNGQMGVVLFFYHYARYTENGLYSDFADILLDKLCSDIHEQLPVTFSNGICGIAWTINYLLNNKFIEGEPDEILRELDELIVKQDIRRMKDRSFETGLEGLYTYVRARISKDPGKSYVFGSSFLQEFIPLCQDFAYRDEKEILTYIIDKSEINFDTIHLAQSGINNGCSGFGLKLIFA